MDSLHIDRVDNFRGGIGWVGCIMEKFPLIISPSLSGCFHKGYVCIFHFPLIHLWLHSVYVGFIYCVLPLWRDCLLFKIYLKTPVAGHSSSLNAGFM